MLRIKTCKPPRLPVKNLDWKRLIPFLGPAHRAIASFQDSLIASSNSTFNCWIQKEVNASASSHTEKEGAISLLNYENGIRNLPKLEGRRLLSKKLLCHLKALIEPGEGKFRKVQSWIGPEGCPAEEAYFYAPNHKLLNRYIDDLVHYAQHGERDPLVHLAIIFAQFLIIHPFTDGNGRVARLYIPLYLYRKGMISAPLFFMSSYFKKHRNRYFELLFNISIKNTWEDWIEFFLVGITLA